MCVLIIPEIMTRYNFLISQPQHLNFERREQVKAKETWAEIWKPLRQFRTLFIL